MSEIKNCPFCGSKGEIYPDGEEEGYQIFCSGDKKLIIENVEYPCPMNVMLGYNSHDRSVTAWNNRV